MHGTAHVAVLLMALAARPAFGRTPAPAQAPPPAPHLPRGTATDVGTADITATVAVSDQAVRVVGVDDGYNVSIGVVHRARKGLEGGGAIEHSRIAEVYHVSRVIGPGDVVIIPPNTPHWFREIASDQIIYLVVRIDPHKVLPAGYGAK